MTPTIELIEHSIVLAGALRKAHLNVPAQALENAAKRLRELDKPDCMWTFDADQGMYDTGCGEAWCFEEGGTAENKVKFCPNCGGAVKEAV